VVTLIISVEVIFKHVNAPSFVVNNNLETLKFLSTTITLTPPQIGVGLQITLISNTLHAQEVFTMPITTFEETLNCNKNKYLDSESN
jgi:hypothetical protein